MVSLTSGHLVGLTATLGVFLLVTVYAARSVRSAEGFSLCGRSAGVLLVAGGISGTCVGGAATIGSAQMAFSFGLSAWWFTVGVGSALVIMAGFYARPLRKSGLETMPQFLTVHYRQIAGPLVSVISSIGILFSAVASTLSGIAPIAMIFHIAPWQAAAIIVVLVAISVFFGGMKGAGLSGLLKMAVIWVALCAAGVVASLSLARMADFHTVFPADPWFSLAARGVPDCLGNLASLMVGMICTQTYVQAIYSGANTRVAATGTLIAALITIPVGLPCVAVGMFMHAAHPDIQPILALPMYLVLYLPSWLGGVGLAGILFSIVGSIAGLALGIGTMVAHDIGRGVLHIKSGRRILLINRFTVLATTCLAMAIALGNPNSYVLDWNYMSMALRGAGVFIPFTLAIFWPYRLAASWAVASMVVSTAVAVLVRFGPGLSINPLFPGLLASLLVVGIGLAVSVTRNGWAGNAGRPG
jgi:SSS family solute:Na+ symporter